MTITICRAFRFERIRRFVVFSTDHLAFRLLRFAKA
jgi:hypothetical protein